MNNLIIGIDIGATNTRIATINDLNEIVEIKRIPSRLKDGRPFFEHVAELAKAKVEENNVKAIGIGTAGQIHKKTGTYLSGLTPQAAWVGIPIKKIIQNKTGLPTFVDNDCKISAYGELKVGKGRDFSDFISLTLGTGIGGGIIINREIVHGEKGLAGHLGHISIYPDGPVCYCGNVGCLESYASGTAVGRLATKAFKRKIDSKETFQLASQGNKTALKVISQMGLALGRGLGIMGNMLNPQAFILGGSIMEWYDYIESYVREGFSNHAMHDIRNTPILQSSLGGDGGVIGAALFAKDQV